jgi:integrase
MTNPSKQSGGRATRTPVIHNGRRVPGLYERKTSTGERVYEVCTKRGGKVIRRRLAAQTGTDAVREQRSLLATLDTGAQLISRPDVSLRELQQEWEQWARSPASTLAAGTVELYADLLDRRALRMLGASTKAAAVRPAHLRAMVDKLSVEGLSGSSVHGTLTAVSALFRFAVRRDLVETNPVRLLERDDRPSTKRTKEPRYLDRSEIDRLLAKIGEEFRPVAAVCAFAGLRISEALALRWQDVDFTTGVLHVPGTKTAASAAPVPMSSALVSELRAHRDRRPGLGDALVFRTASGQPQRRHNAGRAVRVAGDAAGLNGPGQKKVSPHDLRHSCAGLLLAAGVSAPKVAAILRHADPRITLMVYAGLVESQRAELKDDLELALGGGAS